MSTPIRARTLLMRAAALVLGLGAVLAGAGAPANAAPDTPGVPAASTGKQLPKGFPDDLRRFVGGTDEFRSGPWFSGVCAQRGGDLGAYIDAALTVEDRMIYWASNEEARKQMLGGVGPTGVTGLSAERYVTDGIEPPASMLPKVFPAGDPAYAMPTGYCAEDLKRWSNSAWNTWGLTWAAKPDAQSLNDIRKLPGYDRVPAAVWSDPCGSASAGAYCGHAFFLDCEHADPAPDDLRRCLSWNRAVAALFVGTAQWIDANTSLADHIGAIIESSTAFKAAAAYHDAWAWVWGSAVPNAVRFVIDPQSVIDDWADASKDGAVQLSSQVLEGLADVGGFDPSAPWFLRWYALSTGLGVVVMAVMTILAIWRAGSKGETIKTLGGDLLGYAPAGLVLMLFAPMLAQMLVEVSNALSESITRTSGPDMGEMIDSLTRFTGDLTAPMLPGGAIVGLILFLLLIAGSLGIFFGLLMHANALPVLAVAAGIGFGMWVHPKWRPKALRPVLVFIGIVFSKPLLFLLLAVETSLIDAELTDTTTAQGDTSTLGKLCMIVASFIVVGLAPWSLIKYAPLLPTRADASGFGAHSGSLLAGTIGGLSSSHMWYGRGRGGAGGARDRGDRSGAAPASGGSGGGRGRAGGGGDPGPAWRTRGRGDGRSATEARFGDSLARRGGRAGARPGTGGDGAGAGSGAGRALAGRVMSGAGSAAMLAVPVAAQASAAALNKARSAAEATPGEAEQQQ